MQGNFNKYIIQAAVIHMSIDVATTMSSVYPIKYFRAGKNIEGYKYRNFQVFNSHGNPVINPATFYLLKKKINPIKSYKIMFF